MPFFLVFFSNFKTFFLKIAKLKCSFKICIFQVHLVHLLGFLAKLSTFYTRCFYNSLARQSFLVSCFVILFYARADWKMNILLGNTKDTWCLWNFMYRMFLSFPSKTVNFSKHSVTLYYDRADWKINSLLENKIESLYLWKLTYTMFL